MDGTQKSIAEAEMLYKQADRNGDPDLRLGRSLSHAAEGHDARVLPGTQNY